MLFMHHLSPGHLKQFSGSHAESMPNYTAVHAAWKDFFWLSLYIYSDKNKEVKECKIDKSSYKPANNWDRETVSNPQSCHVKQVLSRVNYHPFCQHQSTKHKHKPFTESHTPHRKWNIILGLLQIFWEFTSTTVHR